MRILLLDNDLSYAHVVSDVLSAVGWTPVAFPNASEALGALRDGHPELAVVSLDMGLEGAKEFLKGLAKAEARTGVLLSSGRMREDDPEVVRLSQRFNAVGYLRRPYPLLDLPEALKAAYAETRARTLQVDGGGEDSLAQVVELWMQRRTGTLSVDGEEIGALISGASVETATLDALGAALRRGAKVVLTPGRASAERVDRAPTGALLWQVALEGADKGFASQNLQRAVYVAGQLRKLQELPLSRDCQRMLRSADGNLRLAKHLKALKVMPSAISEELHALHRMALIRMRDRDGAVQDQAPTVSRFTGPEAGEAEDSRRRRAARPAMPQAAGQAAAPPTAARPTRPPAEETDSTPSTRSRDAERERRRAERRRRSSGGEEDARRRAARELMEAAGKAAGGAPRDREAERERRRAERRRREERERQEAAAQASPPPISAEQAREALMMLKRLRRELARVESADCWTILGIPGTQDLDQVTAAADRMRRRYRKIAAHEGFSDEIARMAKEISKHVDRAEQEARVPRGPESAGENEGRAFQAGTEAMAKGDWALAARAFRTAHLSKVDEPAYMAHLGWALFQQAQGESGAKAEGLRKEAQEMLELCDTWDAGLAQGQAWLARVEIAAGDLARAEARVRRLKRQDTDVVGLAEIEAALDEALLEGDGEEF
ncbi:MAG: response regulator [Alphaproteobacteria bacterium]|nr:response regulator [Alphaproteobacteria bacterium]